MCVFGGDRSLVDKWREWDLRIAHNHAMSLHYKKTRMQNLSSSTANTFFTTASFHFAPNVYIFALVFIRWLIFFSELGIKTNEIKYNVH